MDGYNVEELYYLYRQNNPIAKALLIKYCYWKAELMLPMYYFYNGIFYNEREDCIQEIVILVFRNLDGYRPDKGGLVKSYMSLIMHRAISTIIVNEKKKGLRKIKNTYLMVIVEIIIILLILRLCGTVNVSINLMYVLKVKNKKNY